MGIVIAVASGKGGTGKTSVTGGVAAALAMAGQRVLCIDMDIGLRNLDISLGLSDRALMDFADSLTPEDMAEWKAAIMEAAPADEDDDSGEKKSR